MKNKDKRFFFLTVIFKEYFVGKKRSRCFGERGMSLKEQEGF